jgi:hypothetical protein
MGLRAPEFWLLVVASLAAAGGVQAWVVVPLTLAGLSIASLPKYVGLWPRVRRAGAEREWLLTVSLSMFSNLATACAALPPGYGHSLVLGLMPPIRGGRAATKSDEDVVERNFRGPCNYADIAIYWMPRARLGRRRLRP